MKGMLFSQMEPPPELEAAFNDWYETEHIPVRLALPGFARALRYRLADAARRYLAVYEIDDLAVLESAGYNRVKTQPSERTAHMLKAVRGFTRYTCSLVQESGSGSEPGEYLVAIAFSVPRQWTSEFDHWYTNEQLPLASCHAEWLRGRCYSVFSGEGGPWTHFVLHELRSRAGTEDAVWQGIPVAGPHAALAGEGGLQHSAQWVYERVSVHPAP